MSLNPISTLNTINEITSSEDVLMIMDASDTETKQILISEFNTAVQSNINVLSGSFSGSFEGDGSGITGVTGEWDGSHLGDASITGSFTVSGSNSLVDFSNVEGGVSGSFSGSYSGSFNGDGSGLFNITIESASYIQSTGVDGPYGMDSILSASYAVSSSYTISSSYAVSSSSTISSSYALTASYYDGPSGVFTQTGSFYATTNDLQVTGSFDVDTPSSEQLTVSGNMDIGGRLDNSGSIVYELGPSLEAGALERNFLNGEIGGFTDPNAIYQSGSNTYLYEQQNWDNIFDRNQMDISPFTGSEYIGQCIRVWYKDFNNSNDTEQSLFRFRRGSGVTWDLNNLTISAGNAVDIQAQNPISGSTILNGPTYYYGGSGSMCEIYCVGEDEYFAVSTGIQIP